MDVTQMEELIAQLRTQCQSTQHHGGFDGSGYPTLACQPADYGRVGQNVGWYFF